MKKGIQMKLNVRPVYLALVHNYFFEGPCRMAPTEQLTPEFESMAQAQMSKYFIEDVNAHLENDPLIHIMDPIYVVRDDEMTYSEEMFETITKDNENVDLYLFALQMVRGDIVVEVAERTNKPVMIQPQTCCMYARTISHVRAHGKEGYTNFYWEDAVKQMHALRLRKVMAHTNILQVVRMGEVAGSDITSNAFYNQHEVTRILGTRFRAVNIHEILDQFRPGDPMANHTTPGRMGLNPTEEDQKEIEKITDELIEGANEVGLQRDKILISVRMWYIVQKFLKKYDCNAFVAPCPQFCATRRANEEQVTFCLTHSLNNEIGIPSACEADAIAALSMQLLTNASGCSTYMGETNPMVYDHGIARAPYSPLTQEDLPNDDWKEGNIESEQNLMFTFHSVSNRKLRGLDGPDSSYGIQPFAYSGWGATMRNDFKEDKGQVITMCRLSPDCSKLFVAKGTIMGGAYKSCPNCTHTVIFQVKDNRDFYEKQIDFGQHIPLTYGDCADELKLFAKSVGLEVVEA
ncbi:L-fucose isomerase and related proteins [uncultured Roseburia sp.]|uniref:Fucose isomerase n=1 Tax=Brotonthovivens ammoniilytica TaxID=2981725 RepID=A0ABT2TG61_9FIRM|nr:fucose isomerase [Brotonthovivens ammoniilytica]MCU6761183.1 fucose isomerase [Brotonthovivens ammoniilytica]SCI21292.1 L-fucose isomerase and related proteins [uncultured Roseburia sp.]